MFLVLFTENTSLLALRLFETLLEADGYADAIMEAKGQTPGWVGTGEGKLGSIGWSERAAEYGSMDSIYNVRVMDMSDLSPQVFYEPAETIWQAKQET